MRQSIKEKARKLKREISASAYALQDRRLPWLPRVVLIFKLGYASSPVDLIPDFIPVLGYLDDLLIVPGLITLALRMIPAEIMREARRKADEEPLRLHKNWFFGALFILVWVAALAALGMAIFGR
jgi:uncharacterized membrane protein YkvA (DUF1232 family)